MSKQPYTPYLRHQNSIKYRQQNRLSSTTKLVLLIVWFALIMIFV